MQADISGDEDSLFGSPTSSPVRGRSPSLALPGAGGGDCTQNVGTIALPGSHAYIELPFNTAALSLSGSSFYEPSQRPPAIPPSRPQVEPQARPVRAQSDSAHSMRGEKKKKKTSRENSSAPRAPPPPIHLPDPTAPPPANFLRNQQALLGMAGLIGGVHPANLSIQRHTRGSNASNPIVVEDNLNPPLGRNFRPQPVVDTSKIIPPSNEEIVASLIREKNVFPVLESILKLIAGNARPMAQTNEDRRGGSEEPAAKRRRVDAPPPGTGDGSGADLEKERGKQLIAQLVSLIKNAARQAAVRTYQQHHPQARRPHHNHRWPAKQQTSEPKILGHYRPITATYGRPDVPLPEVLADQSNTSPVGPRTLPITNTYDVHSNVPTLSPPTLQATWQHLPFASESIASPPNSFDHLLSSLFSAPPGPGDSQGEPGWNVNADAPSEAALPDMDQNTMDSWMSLFNSLPSGNLLSETSPAPPTNFNTESLMCTSADFPMHDEPMSVAQGHSLHDPVVAVTANTNPDFAIDPFLLAMSVPTSATTASQSPSQDFSTSSHEPSLLTSPTKSAHSTIGYSTPQLVPVQEHGAYALDQDPIMAANALLQFASAAPSVSGMTQNPAAPTANQNALRPTYQLFPQIASTSIEQTLVPAPRPYQASHRAVALRPMPTADKQDILTRARERRRQLVGEIDRAKVELWETTIEQGVLAQLVKEKF